MIFGLLHSAFKSGETLIELPNTRLDEKFLFPEVIEQVSVLNGRRHFIRKGDYSEFTNIIHLWKYADPSETYNTVMSYYGQDVIFYPHLDATAIKDIFGNDVLYTITNIEIYPLTSLKSLDVLTITFKSNNYTILDPNLIGYGMNYGVYS